MTVEWTTMSSFNENSPSQSPIRGFFYKLKKNLSEDSEASEAKLYEPTPFYLPGLDLVQIVHSIPYELEKIVTLSFELSTKSRIVLNPHSTTCVPTKTILTSNPLNWELKIHQHEQADYMYRRVKVLKGTLPYLYKGSVEVKVKNITSEDVELPENYVIAKLFCRRFKY